jgi:hypothetical protein
MTRVTSSVFVLTRRPQSGTRVAPGFLESFSGSIEKFPELGACFP